MIRKNRIVVGYSLSVLERTQASKLIRDHKKEYLKPYGYISLIQKAAVAILAVAVLFNVITLLQFSLRTTLDSDFLARTKMFSIALLVLFGVALALFKLYDVLMNNVMQKQQPVEQEDAGILQKVKLNRFFVETITPNASGKIYWKNVKDCYRKNGFIFIHMKNDNCVVIPERVFASAGEVAEVFDFINVQIAQNK